MNLHHKNLWMRTEVVDWLGLLWMHLGGQR